jgi:hypothetical protein
LKLQQIASELAGRGVGASHQTGWTALVARCLEAIATGRTARAEAA